MAAYGSQMDHPGLRDFDVLTQENDFRIAAFRNSFAWPAERFAELLHYCSDPVRAARQYLRRQCELGMLCCGEFDVVPCDVGDGPLWSSDEATPPNYDALAYALEKRFSRASRSTRVYWPSSEFAKRYGSWTGCDHYPSPHKISHDVLISSVWLRYLRRDANIATSCWISERRLQWMARKERTTGPIPDALIVGGNKPRATEIAGNYGAAWLQHHIDGFTASGWISEIW